MNDPFDRHMFNKVRDLVKDFFKKNYEYKGLESPYSECYCTRSVLMRCKTDYMDCTPFKKRVRR